MLSFYNVARMMRTIVAALCILISTATALAQSTVTVQVNLQQDQGVFSPVYSWFGYDESDNTMTPSGQALLRKLHDLTPAPVHVRAHFLLTNGEGEPGLKWGYTNVYSEDAHGNPVYNWTRLDRIFDAWVHAGVHPMVELGFMPKALSSHPNPYHIPWPGKPGETEGWSYPPNNYKKWQDLIHHVAAHLASRYGMAEVSTWYWEVWNEPDIFYWHGTEQQYFQLYDYAAAGLREAIPHARVGGPATTGPAPGSRSAAFLKAFLRHCAEDRSSATGGPVPLDFISFHAKGNPHFVAGHVQMGLSQELENAATGFAIIHASPRFSHLPVILSEADPEGCGACSPPKHPEDAYRDGTLYPAYTAAAMKGLTELAESEHIDLIGFVTWAFEFENQPYFSSHRALSTNGIDKPELNFFRMAGLLGGSRVEAISSASVPAESIVKSGVREHAEVDAIATHTANTAAVLVWNYQDNAVPGPGAAVHASISGVPNSVHRVLVEQFRIDKDHSNAFTAWKEMGSPQHPDAEQYAKLEEAGQLQQKSSPMWATATDGRLEIELDLPRESLALLRLSWYTSGK